MDSGYDIQKKKDNAKIKLRRGNNYPENWQPSHLTGFFLRECGFRLVDWPHFVFNLKAAERIFNFIKHDKILSLWKLIKNDIKKHKDHDRRSLSLISYDSKEKLKQRFSRKVISTDESRNKEWLDSDPFREFYR